jgi:hypothetical protein
MCRNNLSGEHPYRDIGQITAFIILLSMWIIDSFIFRFSTVLADHLSLRGDKSDGNSNNCTM